MIPNRIQLSANFCKLRRIFEIIEMLGAKDPFSLISIAQIMNKMKATRNEFPLLHWHR